MGSNHVAMGGDDSAKLSVEEVLYLATRGGANVVGLGEKIGGLGLAWNGMLSLLVWVRLAVTRRVIQARLISSDGRAGMRGLRSGFSMVMTGILSQSGSKE